jgi:hypothetical protein
MWVKGTRLNLRDRPNQFNQEYFVGVRPTRCESHVSEEFRLAEHTPVGIRVSIEIYFARLR